MRANRNAVWSLAILVPLFAFGALSLRSSAALASTTGITIHSPADGEHIFPEIEDVFVRASVFDSDGSLKCVRIHLDGEYLDTVTGDTLRAEARARAASGAADGAPAGHDTGLGGQNLLLKCDIDSKSLAPGWHTVKLTRVDELVGGAEAQVRFFVESDLAKQTKDGCGGPPPVTVDLDADSDRTGAVERTPAEDSVEHKGVTLNDPWAIVLVNSDDDDHVGANPWDNNDEDGEPDETDSYCDNHGAATGRDDEVDKTPDKDDFAELVIEQIPEPYSGKLVLTSPAADLVRIFHRNIETTEAVIGPDSPAPALPDSCVVEEKTPEVRDGPVTYYVEGVANPADTLDHGEHLTVKLEVRDGETLKGEDEVEFTVAPWLMLSNTATVEKVYATRYMEVGGEPTNSAFLADLTTALTGTGASLVEIADHEDPEREKYEQDAWSQDQFEIGYQTAPGKTMHVVLESTRDGDHLFEDYPEDRLVNKGVGYRAPIGSSSNEHQFFGNLEVSPPFTDKGKPPVPDVEYPFGRIITSTGLHTYLKSWLKKQRMQTKKYAAGVRQLIELDTSWLSVKHVDEVMSFVKDGDGLRLLVADTGLGIELLVKTLTKKDTNCTCTAVTATTITDANKSWLPAGSGAGESGEWQYGFVVLTSGDGTAGKFKGQVRKIESNTATTITVARAWVPEPDIGDTFEVYGLLAYGTVSGGTDYTLTDGLPNSWDNKNWAGGIVVVYSGKGSGQAREIGSNTSTTLTLKRAWEVVPDGTSKYAIWGRELFRAMLLKEERPPGGGLPTKPCPEDYGAHSANVLLDTTKSWTEDHWADAVAEIRTGTGSGQLRKVTKNMPQVVTIKGRWDTALDGTSAYHLHQAADAGNVDSATQNTLTDDKGWAPNQWTNGVAEILTGAGSGQLRKITANTADTLTVAPNWDTIPQQGDGYRILTSQDSGTSADMRYCIVDTTKTWKGYKWPSSGAVMIVAGTGYGQIRKLAAAGYGEQHIWLATPWLSGELPDSSSMYVVVKRRKDWNDQIATTSVYDILSDHGVRAGQDDSDNDELDFQGTFLELQEKIHKKVCAPTGSILKELYDNLGKPDNVIRVPALFKRKTEEAADLTDCVAWLPGMTNLLVVGTTNIIAWPFGPSNGATPSKDLYWERVSTDLPGTSKPVDCWLYHVARGGVHCGTNVKRTPPSAMINWWETWKDR